MLVTYMIDAAVHVTNVVSEETMRDFCAIVVQRQLATVFAHLLPFLDGAWQSSSLCFIILELQHSEL
jgi:hypothetical protein